MKKKKENEDEDGDNEEKQMNNSVAKQESCILVESLWGKKKSKIDMTGWILCSYSSAVECSH